MRLFKGFGKKGQSGQSLVILALGFLALLGFVGIVTDVSVLFIRYSTMRRAVDAAAIAAAGQMRRVNDPTPGTVLEGGNGLADDEAISVANLNLAARQFIEVYGLNPKSVIVETCRAQQVWRNATGIPYDDDPLAGGVALYIDDPLNPGTIIENPAADPEVLKRYKQLCTADELKLVRVTAQIDSPTIFLSLLGYPTVTLTESAISQTAVLDVVLIFDVSESMLNQTTYDDWDTLTPKLGVRYMPPYVDRNDIWDTAADLTAIPPVAYRQNPWTFIADRTQDAIDPYIDPALNPLDPMYNQFHDKTIMFEPCTVDIVTCPNGYKEYTNAGASPVGRVQPREFCTVRAYSSSVANGKSPVAPDLLAQYTNYFSSATWLAAHPGEDVNYQLPDASAPINFSGFVPMYNYYGCCNDPNGDFVFDDLICQPFKQARDAAHQFLSRLDFLRGDRVGYVTFNRQAFIVDPDGSGGPQANMIETEHNLPVDPLVPAGPLLRKGAAETLDDVVGVMAELSNYADTNNNGLWDGLVDSGAARSYAQLHDTDVIGNLVNNPVNGACPDDKAVLDPPYLASASKVMPDLSARTRALLEEVMTVPTWYMTNGIPSASVAPATAARSRSYENRASCAGTNIGGALATGSSALFTEGRREGAVWIMVLLSDGAAGASNPITKINNVPIAGAQPYATDGSGHLLPLDGIGGVICTDPASPNYPCPENNTGGYGFFGLCPYGTEANPTQLLRSNAFPSCSDLDPSTRTYCGLVSVTGDSALNADTDPAGCINFYDVDDYARDWADWIGVSDLPGSASGGTTGRVGDQLLPTIFTIGFGLNFEDGQGVDCSATANPDACRHGDPAYPGTLDNSSLRRLRNADYLGEELLRYIADVGDNFQIDSDFWQLDMGTRIGNDITPPPAPLQDWGVRGACENPIIVTGSWDDPGRTYLPKPPQESCGNYYWAASGQQLEDVFNQIASRMFTRLSQ